MGYVDMDTSRGLRINNSAAAIQAAIDGQGIALGRSVMVQEDLAASRLVRPFGKTSCPLAFAYYAVYRPEAHTMSSIMTLCDWLLKEATMDTKKQKNR